MGCSVPFATSYFVERRFSHEDDPFHRISGEKWRGGKLRRRQVFMIDSVGRARASLCAFLRCPLACGTQKQKSAIAEQDPDNWHTKQYVD